MMNVEEFTGKTVWDILVSESEIDLNKIIVYQNM